MDTKILLMSLVSIPIILLIAQVVFESFFSGTRANFEQTITGEVLDSDGVVANDVMYTDYPAKSGTLKVYFDGTLATEGTNYTVDYRSGLYPAKITALTSASNNVTADYTAYSQTGYTNLVKTYKQTLRRKDLEYLTRCFPTD